MTESFFYDNYKSTIKEIERYREDNSKKLAQIKNKTSYYIYEELFNLIEDVIAKKQLFIAEIEKEIQYDERRERFINFDDIFIIEKEKEILWNDLTELLKKYIFFLQNQSLDLPPSFYTSREGFITDIDFLKEGLSHIILAYHSLFFLEFELRRELNYLLENVDC